MLLVAEDGLGGRRISRGSRVLGAVRGGRRDSRSSRMLRAGACGSRRISRGARVRGRCM